MRALFLGLALVVLPLIDARSSGLVLAPAAAISPSSGTTLSDHTATGSGLPPDVPIVTALFDPQGNQIIRQDTTNSAGSVSDSLQPPQGGWQVGLYRWVVSLANGVSTSATFAVQDGTPHLYALPDLPSPTSAFNFVGIGLPANAQLDVVVLMTGAEGQRTIHVTTDAGGTFSALLFPQQVGLPFYAAGNYIVQIPTLGLSTPFIVREHPVSATLTVDSAVYAGWLAEAHFQFYRPGRYLWTVLADSAGATVDQYLLGPTDKSGFLRAALLIGAVPPGQAFLATPYDWGESALTVAPPIATPVTVASPTGAVESPSRH